MLRDPRLWGDDADEFKPERFMPEHNPRYHELPDLNSISFGFGRRICPGRYMAERSGLLFSASMLATYAILPPVEVDAGGMPKPIRYSTGQIQ